MKLEVLKVHDKENKKHDIAFSAIRQAHEYIVVSMTIGYRHFV